MAENTTEVLVGGAVLAVAIGFLLYAGQAAGLSRAPDNYTLTASFRSVQGVTVGTDVRMAGVKVGTITALDLNPQTFFADATFTVAKDIQIPTDSVISIASEGLLGGSFAEIVPGGAMENLEPGAEIEDTQGAVSVVTLLMKFAGGSGESTPAEGDAAP